ncbi:hypothetical protein ZWY2020_020992 [Hordeum vulgare]|nr:hypothetical protein ZWY2020_020992 [Hordeum vulgare]
MVKGRTGQHMRLYVRRSILGFKRLWIRIIGCVGDEARRLTVGRWAAGDGSASPDASATRLWIRIRCPPLFPLLEAMCYSPTCVWPFSWIGRRWLKEDDAAAARSSSTPPADTVDAWYRALECGDFWFPAQVYNRKVVNYSSLCSALN